MNDKDSSLNEIKDFISEKGNGKPYVDEFDKKYINATSEEKEEYDKIMKELDDLIGVD